MGSVADFTDPPTPRGLLSSGLVKPELEEKLAEALAKDEEFHGGDPMLALQVAEMTEEQKLQSRKNVEDCIAMLRRHAVKKPPDGASSV